MSRYLIAVTTQNGIEKEFIHHAPDLLTIEYPTGCKDEPFHRFYPCVLKQSTKTTYRGYKGFLFSAVLKPKTDIPHIGFNGYHEEISIKWVVCPIDTP